MLEFFKFATSDLWIFVGCVLLIRAAAAGVAKIILAFKGVKDDE